MILFVWKLVLMSVLGIIFEFCLLGYKILVRNNILVNYDVIF